MTRSIKQDEYDRYVGKMNARRGSTTVGKQEIEQMGIGVVLQVLGIMDAEAFLNDAATTLGTVVYIPEEWDLDRKVIVRAHEEEHVEDFGRKGPDAIERVIDKVQEFALEQEWAEVLDTIPLFHSKLRSEGLQFVKRYALPANRALIEAHAYAVGAEVQFARDGSLASLDGLTEHLRHGYGLGASDVADARLVLESRLSELNATHKIRSTVAQFAAKTLRDIDSELVIAEMR